MASRVISRRELFQRAARTGSALAAGAALSPLWGASASPAGSEGPAGATGSGSSGGPPPGSAGSATSGGSSSASGAAPASGAPAIITRDGARPSITSGIASGDISAREAVVWSRCDRPARMIVEYSRSEAFRDVRRVPGPAALEDSDFTAKLLLTDLPPGETIFYRVRFEDLAKAGVMSEPVTGRLRTAPVRRRDIRFGWSGDVCGQGWGINPDLGGMRIFDALRRQDLDFFVHAGDAIYADNPIASSVTLPDGRVWRNLVTPEKEKVAETLDEFRGNFRYNLLDEHYRRFFAEVPLLAQWDDHETVNNWYPGRILDDARYRVKSCYLLSARARRAMFEYMPMRVDATDPERIHRVIRYGPLLDLFLLDLRSHRGPNTQNRQTGEGPETRVLGPAQLQWLKTQLRASRATWKVIACTMPVGLVIPDGDRIEGLANGDGPPLGRELELAGLLRFIASSGIRNVVWITADVHYPAAHRYEPGKAQFREFLPFWEFVAGPLNAGTFGPNRLDDTFGPQLRFLGIPQDLEPNRSPLDGHQSFGTVRIDGDTAVMTVTLHDPAGAKRFSIDLRP